jgi:hypothetical protein
MTTKLDRDGTALQVGGIAYLMDPTFRRDRYLRVQVTDLCPQLKTIVKVRVLQVLYAQLQGWFEVGEIVDPVCTQLKVLDRQAEEARS